MAHIRYWPVDRTSKDFIMLKAIALGGAVLAISASGAFAHITLATPEAPAGSSYNALFQVPHGCDGAATTKLRVRIPDGMIGVKPQPKAGWTLETVKGPYDKAYTLYGTRLTEGVREVVWSGGNLPDAFYDEFLLRGTLSADLPAGTELFFPVIQECGSASEAWIEIPAAGQPEPDLPAPGVRVLEPAGNEN
jgi:uncharacterized protein YcnI